MARIEREAVRGAGASLVAMPSCNGSVIEREAWSGPRVVGLSADAMIVLLPFRASRMVTLRYRSISPLGARVGNNRGTGRQAANDGQRVRSTRKGAVLAPGPSPAQ